MSYRFLQTVWMLSVILLLAGSALAVSPNLSASSPVAETEIDKKYALLGGSGSFLGAPLGAEQATTDKKGFYRKYQNGVIYWTQDTGAHEMHGEILAKWQALGKNGANPIGYPTTDERIASDGIGRYNNFQNGFLLSAIYWSPQTGAHDVRGDIYRKWMALGGTKSAIGYPTTGDTGTPNLTTPNTRFSNFQNGAIYWKWGLGAFEVRSAIYDEWKRQGGEAGKLGFPISDELPDPSGVKRYSKFEKGTLYRNWRAPNITSLPEQWTPPFVAVHDRSLTNLAAEHSRLSGQGFRIQSLSIYGDANNPLYACVWVYEAGPEQRVHLNVSASTYQDVFNSNVADGFKPTIISATGSIANPVFAGVFEKRPGDVPLTRLGLISGPSEGPFNADTFAYWCKWARENHHVLRWAAVYGDANNPRYAGIWELDKDDVEWNVAYHDAERKLVTNIVPEGELPPITRFEKNDLQAIFEAQSFWARPAFLTHSSSGRFIEVFRDDHIGDWVSRVNLTSAQYQDEFNRLVSQGYLPTCVQGAKVNGASRFTAIFARQLDPKPRKLAVTGQSNKELGAFDEAMGDIVTRNNVRSASLAIARNGRLVYARAFTWGEDDYKVTEPENIFRFASCSKVVTATAIHRLTEIYKNGRAKVLNLSDKLVDHLPQEIANAAQDPWFREITIEHLLQHISGLERNSRSYEEMLKYYRIDDSNKTLPLTIEDELKYMASLPLLYQPGKIPADKEKYSNVGFMFLNYIVERHLGDYVQAVNRNFFNKVGVSRVQVTGSQTTDQGDLEVLYPDRFLRVGRSGLEWPQKIVPSEYGTIKFDNAPGVGGLAMSPADYVRFLSVLHSGNGTLLKSDTIKLLASDTRNGIMQHGGLLSGAVSYVMHFERPRTGTTCGLDPSKPDTFTVAVVFNKVINEDYVGRLRGIIDALPNSAWPCPPFDLFPKLGIQ